MDEVKEIARALASGDITRAAEINARTSYPDLSVENEVVEIVRQSIILHLKQGDLEKVTLVVRLFSLPQELSDAALKQGVLSVYYEGNHSLLAQICGRLPMSPELRSEIVGYCESWGQESEAAQMRMMLLGGSL